MSVNVSNAFFHCIHHTRTHTLCGILSAIKLSKEDAMLPLSPSTTPHLISSILLPTHSFLKSHNIHYTILTRGHDDTFIFLMKECRVLLLPFPLFLLELLFLFFHHKLISENTQACQEVLLRTMLYNVTLKGFFYIIIVSWHINLQYFPDCFLVSYVL